ncbi:MAG: hypothetical protein UY44_C0015G0010 [Candidatus Kaiserbacteria bacterium GW2011_GWA2_49_19]|uniref:Uncharacterized protein n=1 Tax=Candidatus Kaiserbacteria bacterium GW2011_GWA2_49_19 TaxID=1618669 RepID=A0A0G1YPB5_9BACT|nr:MAG: hypothetical protein UY44_C0015G0010 [Candidatus Kaiserbacteria bacterium GW2011_GWA2_49_19]
MKNKKGLVKGARFFLPRSDRNGNAELLESGYSMPPHLRIRVYGGADDSFYPRVNERFHARRSLPEMGTRLKIGVESGAGGVRARGRKGFDFRVRTACSPVVSPAYNLPVLHDDGADHRIRVRPAKAFNRQLQGLVHKFLILCAYTSHNSLQLFKMVAKLLFLS